MERLTSTRNQLVKELQLLQDRRGRREAGCFMVEGVRFVQEAFRSGAPVLRLLADDAGMPILSELLQTYPGPEPIWVSPQILEKLSDTKTPQGIIAVVGLPHGGTLFATGCRRILALERVQDPGNVGTMIRTADACGFDAVVLSADSADPWQPKALRSTMGSIWHLPVTVVNDLPAMVEAARGAGLSAFAAHPRDAEACWNMPMADNLMLIIGNEAGGISPEMLGCIDRAVMIPMEGLAESLNAAAAASMLMYESLRQRRLSR